MNKNTKLVVDFAKVAKVKDAVHDMQRNENVSPREVINAFEDMLNSMSESAAESDEDIANRILDSFKDDKSASNEVIRKAVEDAMAKRDNAKKVVDMKNDPEVAKKFADCILNGIERGNGLKLENAMKSAFGNDISTLVFPTQVEVAIRRAWEKSERVLAIFNRTQRESIPYTAQAYTDNDVLARIQSNPANEKTDQHLAISYITLAFDYMYKKQTLRRADLNKARRAGTEVALVAEIFAELTQQVVNGIVSSALITGASGAAGQFIEPIARTTSDIWVNVSTQAGVNPTIAEVRTAADKVITDGNKYIICSSAMKTVLETLASNTTGLAYMPTETLLAQAGCQGIITNEIMGNAVIILAQDAYTIGDFEMETFRWDRYSFNDECLLAEMFTTGKMRQPAGAAIVLPQAIAITISSGTLTVGTGTIANGSYRFVSGGVSEVIAISSGAGTATAIADGTYRVVSNGVGVDNVAVLSLIPA